MADISKITLPNGSSYNFKDATARSGLEGKAPTSHTHDDRYYTESEINTKLSQKIDMGGIIHVARKPTSNGYLKFADITTSGYGNKSIVLWVSTEYNNGSDGTGNAIAYINIRGNGSANISGISKFSWLMKDKNFNTNLYYAVNNHTIEFYRSVKSGEYSQTSFKILHIGNFESASNWTFNFKSVAFVENTPLDTPIGTVVGMTNEGLVEYSNNADTVDGKHASDFAAASHTHTKSQITDFPAIPTKTSQLTNDSGFKTTDSNTTYSLSKSGSTITLTGSDGSTTSVTDSDTTYTLPTATSSTLGGVKIGSNITNSSGTISLTKANVTAALGYTPPTTNTTYGVATQSANGLMSSSDKTKLDGIATGANKITVDSALSSTSTNPVQNKVINSALAGKASTAVATQSTNGLMSTADKKKLDGISGNGLRAVIGTYSYSKDDIYIDLGERPKFVIIYNTEYSSNTVNYQNNTWICADGYTVLRDTSNNPDRIAYEIRDTGFFVTGGGHSYYPNNNRTGPYVYIAFY